MKYALSIVLTLTMLTTSCTFTPLKNPPLSQNRHPRYQQPKYSPDSSISKEIRNTFVTCATLFGLLALYLTYHPPINSNKQSVLQ